MIKKHSKNDTVVKIKDLALIGVMVASLEVAKLALSFLPNIELVSLFIILYTLFFKRKTIYAVFTFILIEGLLYSFGIWWVMYLYIWPLLALLTHLFRRQTAPLFWAVLSGLFGLSFGALCAIPYWVTGGFYSGFSYWIAGIPFDLLHCGGNFFLCLILFKPLSGILCRLRL